MGSSSIGAQPCAPFLRDGIGYIPLRVTGRRGNTPTGSGEVIVWAKVDEVDFADLAQHRWHMTDTGYAHRWFGGRPPKRQGERMHRRILGLVTGDKRQGDHINRDKLDNRRSNLRIVEGDAQNHQNVPARGGFSKHRGVTYDSRRGHWIAQGRRTPLCAMRYRGRGRGHRSRVAPGAHALLARLSVRPASHTGGASPPMARPAARNPTGPPLSAPTVILLGKQPVRFQIHDRRCSTVR
jgi:hypothetical protein